MNPAMATWEIVLMGIVAALVLMFFLPRLRESMKQSDAQTNKDWRGALLPLLAVILFVLLLIALL
jgi:multisubunit Na+/H+ antiporter MnhG subunit